MMGWSKSHVADDYSWQIFGVEYSPRIFLLMTYAAPRGSAWFLYSDPVTMVGDMSHSENAVLVISCFRVP